MRMCGKLVSCCAVLAIGTGALNLAAQEGPRLSVVTTFANQYLWRGFVLNDSPALQPAVTLSYRGFSVSSWSNLAYRAPRGQAWTEHDLTVGYSRGLGPIGLFGGYIHYAFPDVPQDGVRYSHEFYAGVSFNGRFQPALTYYRDVGDGEGSYLYLSGNQSLWQAKNCNLILTMGLGLNQHLWQPHTTISNFDTTLTFEVRRGVVALKPFLTYTVGHRSLFGRHTTFGIAITWLE